MKWGCDPRFKAFFWGDAFYRCVWMSSAAWMLFSRKWTKLLSVDSWENKDQSSIDRLWLKLLSLTSHIFLYVKENLLDLGMKILKVAIISHKMMPCNERSWSVVKAGYCSVVLHFNIIKLGLVFEIFIEWVMPWLTNFNEFEFMKFSKNLASDDC